jgi:hypothetical protein
MGEAIGGHHVVLVAVHAPAGAPTPPDYGNWVKAAVWLL